MKTIKLLFFLLISSSSFSQNYELKGIVFDSGTNEKMTGVHVQLVDPENETRYSTITDFNGEYIIKNIIKGEYQIILSHIGYINSSQQIQINFNLKLEFRLDRQQIPLGEVVVTSLRSKQKIKNIPVPIEIVDKKQFELASSGTPSDILRQESGITLARDGVWSTSVNIRGLGEQRIVTLINGNRIETATDLMAGMAMIDVEDIERIEVIKGASSSLYGTGAMGGIVNIITKDGDFSSKTHFKGSFNAGYNSVNKLFSRNLAFNTGSKKWYLRLSGSLRDADDMETPDGILVNSQFSDQNISLSAGLKTIKNQALKVKYQKYLAEDVGIPGGSVFPDPATATYPKEEREMFSANYEFSELSETLKMLHVKYFYQYILRDVELIPNTTIVSSTQLVTPELITPAGNHYTNGFQMQSNWEFSSNHNFIAGADVWQRKLKTDREKYIRVDVLDSSSNIIATNYMERGETPIPGSKFGSAGIFVQDDVKFLNDRLKLTIGGRFDGIRITNEEAFDVDYIILNDSINALSAQRITFYEGVEYKISWSANLGILYALTDDMDLSFNLGRSFRAPSLEESFKYIDLGSYVRLGDPDLNPEKGYNIDFGFRIWKPKFHFKVNGFANWLSDMIVEEPGEYIYTLTTGVTDTVPAYINANVDEARLYGIDLNFQYNFYGNFVLHGIGSFVRGEDTRNNTSLPLIPPVNGRIGLRYNLPKYFGADIIAVGFADQPKVAEGESETKGFARFDFTVNSALINLDFAKLQFFGGIENLSDRAYRNHLATNRGSIDIEPGRNLYIKMKVLF